MYQSNQSHYCLRSRETEGEPATGIAEGTDMDTDEDADDADEEDEKEDEEEDETGIGGGGVKAIAMRGSRLISK